jgi:hypothetical protein
MPAHSPASRLAALVIFALAGSVLAAGGKSSKTRNPHRPSQQDDDDESVTPPASRKAADEGPPEGVSVKASLESSGYLDTDHVYVASPSVGASISNEVAGWSIGGHFLVDVVSAASVDIVSTASPHWVENRQAGSVDGSFKLSSVDISASGSISREPDYLSITGGGTISMDMLEKNVTPFFGISYGEDQVGRTDLPHDFWKQKQTLSFRLGTTFVVDRETIASVQLDLVKESGYLAKPYRYVPLFAPGEGSSILAGASIDRVNAVRVDERPIEQLPELRYRYAFTGKLAHRYSASTLRLDERVYLDSWGVKASTTDFRFVFDVGQRWTLWPHLRVHVQSGASFWQRAYELIPGMNGTSNVPEIRTGDRELSGLYTLTMGFGTRWRFIDDLRKPWYLLLEGDFGYTRYSDALYITDRRAIFSTLGVEAEF